MRVLALMLAAVPATIAQGQGLGFLDKVFSNVSDVNATRLFGKPYRGRGVIALVPAALQTPLRLSTRTIAVGGQIQFAHEKN